MRYCNEKRSTTYIPQSLIHTAFTRLDMESRGWGLIVGALLMAVLMATPGAAQPIANAEMGAMQGGSSDGQPDHLNNTMFLYGRDNMEPCWGHFNASDEDNANNGYGEETTGSGTLDIEVTCRMETFVKNRMLLKEGEDIHMRFKIEIGGEWRNGQGECAGDCENLNITLMRGGVEAYTQEFPNLENGENDVHWQLPVYPDLVEWNKSQDEPAIKFTMVLKPTTFLVIFGNDAQFRLYFNDEQHSDSSYNATVMFPILNETAADEFLEDELGIEEKTPGFTALIGVGGLAAAALIRPSKKADDE